MTQRITKAIEFPSLYACAKEQTSLGLDLGLELQSFTFVVELQDAA